jgi:hypothetical protein
VKRIFLSTIGALLLFPFLSPLRADITVTKNQAIPSFPREIQFMLSAHSEMEIVSVELEFGTDALTCGQSTSRIIPEEFESGTSIEVEWVWNLRQTGSNPPGTKVWWRWRMTDAAGDVHVTPEKEIAFVDESVNWRTVETDSLLLHWYEGDSAFVGELLEAGETALDDLLLLTGVEVEKQINVYIYASSEVMQSATLFAPAWSGGLAFSEHNTVLIAIPLDRLNWGKRAMAHELAHVMIGRYTYSCISHMPVWLNEGLAENAEGEMDSYYESLLSDAIDNNTLLSVRELGEIFSNDPETATLSYAQSHSLVAFLIERHGQEQMLLLLDQFRDGVPTDQALMDVYELDRDNFEASWREHLGAAPMEIVPTIGPTPTHTPYPTFAPISGPEFEASATPVPGATVQPDASPNPTPSDSQSPPIEKEQSRSSLLPYMLVLGGGTLFIVLIGWFLLRRRRAN